MHRTGTLLLWTIAIVRRWRLETRVFFFLVWQISSKLKSLTLARSRFSWRETPILSGSILILAQVQVSGENKPQQPLQPCTPSGLKTGGSVSRSSTTYVLSHESNVVFFSPSPRLCSNEPLCFTDAHRVLSDTVYALRCTSPTIVPRKKCAVTLEDREPGN